MIIKKLKEKAKWPMVSVFVDKMKFDYLSTTNYAKRIKDKCEWIKGKGENKRERERERERKKERNKKSSKSD
mgnify:CR=1 FL=1